jgi:hypothetical protein
MEVHCPKDTIQKNGSTMDSNGQETSVVQVVVYNLETKSPKSNVPESLRCVPVTVVPSNEPWPYFT